MRSSHAISHRTRRQNAPTSSVFQAGQVANRVMVQRDTRYLYIYDFIMTFMQTLGEDFEGRHCYECGQTFDCVKNLDFHCERTLHNRFPNMRAYAANQAKQMWDMMIEEANLMSQIPLTKHTWRYE